MVIARFVAETALLAAAAVVGVKLWNGRWAFLVAKPRQTKKGPEFDRDQLELAKRASWVMVSFAAEMVALLAYTMSGISGSAALEQTATLFSNAMLLAFGVSVVWTVVGVHDSREYEARFRISTRLILFLLVSCILLTAVSLLFA